MLLFTSYSDITALAMDEDELSLNITPSFKSRSSKGKARATPRSQNNDLDHAENGGVKNNDEDDDVGNSSAVLFKRSSSKNKGKSLLGGATASSSARKPPASGTSTSKSRLNVSFGSEDVGNSEDNATGTSRASSSAPLAVGGDDAENGDESMMAGDVSVSEVRKINRKNRKLGQGIGSSSLTKAAEK